MKKSIALIAVILIIFSLFTACSTKSDASIYGTWVLKENDATIEYTFNEDGTGNMSAIAGMLKVDFAYKIKDGTITFYEVGDAVMGTTPYNCTVNSDKLTLSSGSEELVLERK